jgi:hypothetical protein
MKRVWAAFNASCAGKPAGCITRQGYRETRLNSTNYKAHRLIWKLFTGKEPPATIDHRDRDEANNQWRNLRPATQLEQTWNSQDRCDNTSGFRGVEGTQ